MIWPRRQSCTRFQFSELFTRADVVNGCDADWLMSVLIRSRGPRRHVYRGLWERNESRRTFKYRLRTLRKTFEDCGTVGVDSESKKQRLVRPELPSATLRWKTWFCLTFIHTDNWLRSSSSRTSLSAALWPVTLIPLIVGRPANQPSNQTWY